MSTDIDIVSLMVAVYKDKIQSDQLVRLQEELRNLRQAEADMRRNKADAEIRLMAKLKIHLDKFKHTYENVRGKTGKDITSVEDYIRSIEQKIKDISYRKNNGKIK